MTYIMAIKQNPVGRPILKSKTKLLNKVLITKVLDNLNKFPPSTDLSGNINSINSATLEE